MANQPKDTSQVIDVLTFSGMDVNGLDKSNGATWIQNAVARAGRYEVRSGFGTIAQFGTTMISGRDGTLSSYGYGPPLAARMQITNQSHLQILSVHNLDAFTGMIEGQTIEGLTALSVYDVTTGRRAEHVLRRQTQWTSNMPDVTLQAGNNPQWIQSAVQRTPSFAQLADLTYICMAGQGVYIYRPIDPVLVDQRLQSVTGLSPNGDSSWVEVMQPVNGAFLSAGDTYYNSTTFPQPTALCSYMNRMVYASGRKLYFSDVDRPDNILANSFFPVPTELPITAITSVKGVILAFTSEETWLYQPSSPDQTGLISGGTVYNLSRSIGCLSPSSLVQMADVVVFMDKRGIYTNDGGLAVTKMSDAIDPWFSLPDQIQNPFTSYVVNQGYGNLGNQQPRAWIDFTSQLERATMAWDSQNQFLYITLEDMALVYGAKSGWSVVLFETMATKLRAGVHQVGVQQRITNPIILTHNGFVYLVGGAETERYVDAHQDVYDKSVYILQQGRGGALDRSSVAQEDLRSPSQTWGHYHNGVASLQSSYWLAPPIPLPAGFKMPNGTSVTEQTFLVPFYAANTKYVDAVGQHYLKLRFDRTNWQPVWKAPLNPTPNVDFMLPSERLASSAGWVGVKTELGGVDSYLGNDLVIYWDGSTAPNTWSSWPNMTLTPDLPQPLIYIPMQRTPNTAPITSMEMGWEVHTVGNVKMGINGILQDANLYLAGQSLTYPQQNLGDNTHAQPVDWALATNKMGDGKAQYKARGTYSTIQSYGKAQVQQVPDWIYGPFGSLTASDYKDFSAQQVDMENENPNIILDKATPRDRLQTAASTVPTQKTGAGGARWSDSGNQTTGNLLIDDPAVDTIATSEGVRGEYFRTLLAGCMNANGEAVKVQYVKVLIRQTGGLRRTGRRGQI